MRWRVFDKPGVAVASRLADGVLTVSQPAGVVPDEVLEQLGGPALVVTLSNLETCREYRWLAPDYSYYS